MSAKAKKSAPRAYGTGSVREDERGYFQAAPPPGLVPGRPKKRFRTRGEAEAWLDELMDQARKGMAATGKETVAEFAARWLEIKARDAREITVEDYRRYVDKLIVPVLGTKRMASVQPKDVDHALTRWHKTATPYATHRAFVVMRTMFRDAMRLQVIPPRNPLDGVRPPRYVSKERPRWTGEEAQAFRDKHEGHDLYPFIHVGITTGLRRSELLGLRWRDVDLERGVIQIEQAVTFVRSSARKGELKTPKSQRVFFIDAGSCAMLERQREHVKKLRVFAGERWQENDLVFPSHVGTPYPESQLAKHFRELCDAAGVKRITPYGTRHTYGSLGHESGRLTDKQLSERMGHTTVAFTQQQYVHMSEEARRRAALSFEELTGRSAPNLPPRGKGERKGKRKSPVEHEA